MKVLIITNGFFPGKKYGGPPVSVNNLCSLLNEHEFYIITKNHDLGETEKYINIRDDWNVENNRRILYLSDKDFNKNRMEQEIKKIKPDILYLQSLFQSCTIPCLYLARKYSIKVLLAPRGELCKGAFKKKWKKIPYILFLRMSGLLHKIHTQSTSDEESEMIKKYLRINRSNIHYLTNVPTIPKQIDNYNIKRKNELKIVFLSRIVPKKNLIYALNCLKKVKGKILFDIYGSIEDKDYWNECNIIISELPKNITINYKGIIDHDNVCSTFSKYDLFFFPTKSENFGHVIVESLSVGCPVLISNQTHFDKLESNNCGAEFDLIDEDLFINKINDYVIIENDEWKEMSNSAKKYINSKLNIDKIKEDYNNVLNNI